MDAITVNNSNGGMVIINQQPKKKTPWLRHWKAFGLYFYISPIRMKRRRDTDLRIGHKQQRQEQRKRLYKRQGGCCPECGQPFEPGQMEFHHVLPWGRFPQLRETTANLVLLCHKCHREIHNNPWKNIERMKAKAEELGIDLKDHYDYAQD